MNIQLTKELKYILVVSLVVLLFAFTVLLIPKHPQSRPGDPGNIHLHQLTKEAVFHIFPSDIQAASAITQTPARNQLNDFNEVTSVEPEVTESFVSTKTPREITQFYNNVAANDDWQMNNDGSNGFAATWTKKYPDKSTGLLSVQNILKDSKGNTYVLTGKITPARQ